MPVISESGSTSRLTMDQVRAARLVIAGRSLDANDLAMLLEALGIGKVVDPAMMVMH